MKQKVNLNGMWKLKEAERNESYPKPGDWIDAIVPGNTEIALSKNGVLPKNLYFRDNLKKAKWIEEKCWWYKKEFEFAGKLLEETNLVFNGLDLFTEIYLNGQKIGSTDNMFRQYKFNVNDIIRKGKNEIFIKFLSTKNELSNLYKKHPEYWTIFYPGSTLARKAQYHFGWDWAPEMITSGIWDDVYLENVDEDSIDDVFVETRLDGQLCFRVCLHSGLSDKKFHISDKCETKEHTASELMMYQKNLLGKIIKITVENDSEVAALLEAIPTGINNFFMVKLENPKLWWPNGMGKPNLYQYVVELIEDNEVLDSYTGQFGIRKVEINENMIATDQVGFTIMINTKPIYCKGANWVPADCFPGTIKKDTYKRLISNAVEANFNMLRVWGGGIYEKKEFYEECDKNGIMVWQDFANSCGHPPDDKLWFLDNVIAESEYQVKRLRNHPSVVLWCGGNESSNPWFYSVDSPGRKLMHYYLRGIVGHLTTNTPYISGSPHSKSDFGCDPKSGETHESAWPRKPWFKYADFRSNIANSKVVFNSEVALFGPSPMISLNEFLSEGDIFPPSDVMEYHVMKHPDPDQHHGYSLGHLRMAEELIGPCRNAEQYISNAMMAHGELVREELGMHRSKKFINSGSLLWMFNECWPNSNWAMVDYQGHKKASFYSAKRIFAPVTITITSNCKAFDVTLINDTLKDVSGDVSLSYMDIDGNILWNKSLNGKCNANSAIKIAEINSNLIEKQDTFLRAVWSIGEQETDVNFFPELWRKINFKKSDFEYSLSKFNAKIGCIYETIVKITSRNYSRFLYFHIPSNNPQSYIVEDNYFDLIPGQTKFLKIFSESKIKDIEIRSLFDGNCQNGHPKKEHKQKLVYLEKDVTHSCRRQGIRGAI